MKPKLAKTLVIAVLATLLISMFAVYNAFAVATTIYLNPSSNIYTTSTVSVGFKFNISVWVQNAAVPIGGAQVYMEFNDTVINATRWFLPNTNPNFFMPEPPPVATLPPPPDPVYLHVGPNLGSIGPIAISKGGLPPVAPWGHDGLIMIIEFKVTAVPSEPGKFTSALHINAADTFLLDSDANTVPDVVKQDGYYEVSMIGPKHSLTITTTTGGTTNPAPGTYDYPEGANALVTAMPSGSYIFDHWELDTVNIGASNPVSVTMNADHTLHAVFIFQQPTGSRIFIDPPEIIDTAAVPCQTNFNINVSIDDIANMKTAEFNLTYDSYVLNLIGLNFLAVNGQYPTMSIKANGTAGFVWIRLAYSTEVTVVDPTPLVTLIFHLKNRGVSPLDLTDTLITDPSGDPITHDTFDGVIIAVIRDVAVTGVVASRPWAYSGWPVNVTVTVKNKGNLTETFNVSAYYDANLIGEITVAGLAPDEERTIIFEWNTSSVTDGNYTIRAVADTVPFEMNTSDNTLIDGHVFILSLASIHDVAIVSIASEAYAYQSENALINVTAQNMGVFSETFDVKLYFNGTLMGTKHVTDLSPGSYYKAVFNITSSTLMTLLPCHKYELKGEATVVPFEYNETNNVLVNGFLKIRLPGDVNGDGKVNLIDVFAVHTAFGTTPGNPRWNPDADLNGDGKVDLKDVYIVHKYYGRSCTP